MLLSGMDMGQRCLGVDGVPADDSVGDQGEAFAFAVLVGAVPAPDLSGLGVSDGVS